MLRLAHVIIINIIMNLDVNDATRVIKQSAARRSVLEATRSRGGARGHVSLTASRHSSLPDAPTRPTRG